MGLFLALSFWSLWFLVELSFRNMKLRTFWGLLQKKENPQSPLPAWGFAFLASLLFSFWESFIRSLLLQSPPTFAFVLGLLGLLTILGFRVLRLRRGNKSLSPEWIVGAFVCSLLLLGSWGSFIFLPWIYGRSRFLKKSS